MDEPLTPVSDLERTQVTLEITNSLLSAVSAPDPVPALVSRMSTICRGSAVIFDAEGTVVANHGEAPTNLIWNEVAATHRRDLSFEVGRWHVLTRRVALTGGVHVVVLASRGDETLSRIGELLLDTSERLLGVVHGIRYGASRRDRRENEQLLSELHDGTLPAREHRFWSRLAQFRFAAYAPVRAVELAPLNNGSADDQHVTQLVSRARSEELPLLIMLRRIDADATATVSLLVPDTDATGQWLDAVSHEFLVGSSAPTSSLSNLPSSMHEAETALEIARGRAAATRQPETLDPVLIDQIDLSTWLLSHVNRGELSERIERTLAPIESPQLRETLVTYLAAEQNIARTSDALFLHPNTVRYRLGRIEEALGQSLDSAFMLSNVILALYPELIGRYSGLQRGRTRPQHPESNQGGS